ncbi:MAG: membrane protein insertion efficiency factor YidD [Cyanobacteria bacterium P01_A01_bin.116]
MKTPMQHSKLLTAVAAKLIRGYQKYLSPHKGYHCAHRVLHGGDSCSQYIKTQIENVGLVKATPLALMRFQSCKHSSIALKRRANFFAGTSGMPLPKNAEDFFDCFGDCFDGVEIAACCCELGSEAEKRNRER